MSEFYFDVGAWEKQLAEQGGSIRGSEDAQAGEKRKRLTKKDMVRFFCGSFSNSLTSPCIGTVQRTEEGKEAGQDGMAEKLSY